MQNKVLVFDLDATLYYAGDKIEELCDEYLYIKMNENCESLNASVAASILLYELGR